MTCVTKRIWRLTRVDFRCLTVPRPEYADFLMAEQHTWEDWYLWVPPLWTSSQRASGNQSHYMLVQSSFQPKPSPVTWALVLRAQLWIKWKMTDVSVGFSVRNSGKGSDCLNWGRARKKVTHGVECFLPQMSESEYNHTQFVNTVLHLIVREMSFFVMTCSVLVKSQ